MVKQQENDKIVRPTRNGNKKTIVKSSERNTHQATRGRPKKDRTGSNPYSVQKQFTEQFIEFGKQYLDWKLNDNYVWTTDFDKKQSQNFDRLPFDNQKDEQTIDAIITNMNNMMEIQVGRQFRELCIDSYKACKDNKTKQQASKQLLQKVFKSQNYTYLSLRNQSIPNERRVIKQEVLTSFIHLTIDFVYKVAQKQISQ